MKRTKSILAVALALVMVLAMGLVAFAAGSYKITINNDKTGHTYQAYQIFKGVLAADGKTLSDIEWGNGVSEAGKTALGDAAAKAAGITDANAFAKEVAQYLQNPTESGAHTGTAYEITGLEAGYYLVKDKDNTLANADDFNTAYIMQVVADVTATPKGDKPTLEKEIKSGENWGVAGTSQIGDTVEFRTITTVPDTKEYTKYDYVIHDTMSAGLTSNVKGVDDVTIKVNDETVLDKAYYTVNATGNTFTVKVDILRAVADNKVKKGDKLYTYYSGVVNKAAVVYNVGSQENTAHLEYSNNPYKDEKGKTTPDKVYDWTFKMNVNKVDGENKPLTGAKFVLTKNSTLKVAELACDENGIPTVTDALIRLVKVADNEYRVATKEDTKFTYVIEAGNPVIKGLDAEVEYFLFETKAPDGYNTLKDPVKFKISATFSEDGSSCTPAKVTIGEGEASDTLQADITNNKGTELPSTGGIGTKIFYIAGAILVVLAGVLLITKKRMGKNAD